MFYRTGSYVLLNDVTDFHQVQLKDITNDTKLKSMFTNIPKGKLATTSYGKLHSGRLSAIAGTKCKVVSRKELPKIAEICKRQYSRTSLAIDESKTFHKFKHYKCMKNVQSKSPDDTQISSKPEVSHRDSSRSEVNESDVNYQSESSAANVSTVQQHYSYFSHSRKIRLLPCTTKRHHYDVNSTSDMNTNRSSTLYGGNSSTEDCSRGYRNNPGPNSREYHSKYLDFLKKRECDYDDNNSCNKSNVKQNTQAVDKKKESCMNNNNYVPETGTTSGLQ